MGRRLAVFELGAATGPAVIAFHGTPAGRLSLELMHAPAVKENVRLLCPDRPGVGRSDPAPDRTVLSWADDVAALADALEIDRFGVLGWSCGGPYALACAQRLPDRLLGATCLAGVGPLDRDGALDGLWPSDLRAIRLAVKAPTRARLEMRLSALAARFVPKVAMRSFLSELSPVDVAFVEQQGLDLGFYVDACRGGARGVVQDYRLCGPALGTGLA